MGNQTSSGFSNAFNSLGHDIGNAAGTVYHHAVVPAGQFVGSYTGATGMVNNWQNLTHGGFNASNLGTTLASTALVGGKALTLASMGL